MEQTEMTGEGDIEITFEAHKSQFQKNLKTRDSDNDGALVDENRLIPEPNPVKRHHIRHASRGKSGGSLEEFVADRHDAFDGDLNPFEVYQADDDTAASVGYDGFKPLPVPDQLGNATQFPSDLVLPPPVATSIFSTMNHEPATTTTAAILISEGNEEEIGALLQQPQNQLDSEATKHSSSLIPPPSIPSQREISSQTKDPSTRIEGVVVLEGSEGGLGGRVVTSSSSARQTPRSVITAGIESFKYLYSLGLLIFCIVLVMGSIFTKQTTSTSKGFSTVGAFFIFWFLIVWLAFMEGGQGAIVGLQPIDKSLYRESHPRAFKVCSIVHKGDNMERFIVGRQFLVVLVVFVSQLMSSATPDIQLWGLTKEVTDVFLNSGVALIVVTIVLGQLVAQINAANCMLDFINNYFMIYFIVYLSLAIEFSGLLHSVYLVQILFSKISGQPVETDEPPRNMWQQIFFWARVLLSMLILGFAFAVTMSALFHGQTTAWQGVPESVSVILFFLLMCFVGLMEGMQIALFSVINMPPEELEKQSLRAYRNSQLTFRGENLQAFLIGRQICVTICTFLIARITTLAVAVGEGQNIFGASNALQTFFNTGLLGAVITTIVSSLAWRIVASSFPVAFLSNPVIGLIIRLCLLLEASGICSSAWVLARYHKPMVNYQPDEVYLEGTEPHSAEPVTSRDKDIDRFVTVVRFSYSLALLFFCIILVIACVFTHQTKVTQMGLHPAIAFIIFLFLIFWLGMAEGGQFCLIGLHNVDPNMYSESHPRSLRNTSIAYKGDNMQRFIVGRQFLVLVAVFMIQWTTEPIAGASVLGLPKIVNEIFLTSGFALIIITIILGQLMSQVNAAICMLDFINNYFMLYMVTYFSLAVEYSGILHSVYLTQIVFSKVTGKAIETNEPPLQGIQWIFFWLRVFFSLFILAYSCAVTLAGLIRGETTMWSDVPNVATGIVFFILMCFIGVMEGVQIALFQIANLPEDKLKLHKVAFANFKLALTGQNLQAFLIGRQICVTFFFFIVAKISTSNVEIGVDENIFHVSNGVQSFFNTGLLGALVTTVLASLAWRVIASSFPVTFMSNPLIYLVIRLCLLIDVSGVCSACWVFGRWNKLLFGYQTDEVYLEGAEKQGKLPITRRDKDIDVTITVIKYICSSALLGFGIAVTMSLIFTKQTQLSLNFHPAVAFVLIWFLLIWLSMMEGGQGCLVGLQGVNVDLYKDSHPVTFKNVKIAHHGDNMQRFIVGRQFLVVLVVFITNLCGFPLAGSEVFGLPDAVASVFVGSGLSLILMTVILGQLIAQVNAATSMLDFINNYFMLYFVTYVSMAIEFSGLLHCVYLVQILFSKISGAPIKSHELPPTIMQRAFFWGRAVASLAILTFAFSVTLTALFDGRTTSWETIPDAVSVIIFFILMCLAGVMEGMQIALFAVVNLPEKELAHHKIAKANCRLTFSGNNLQAFLIGRQICVTLCTFIIAQITTLNIKVGTGENIFGVPDGLQAFFNTGLLGALITTVVGSLAWRIIAASFPLSFLSNPLVYLILRLCLIVEASGVCSAAWLLALIFKQIAGYQPDNVYIGSRQACEVPPSDTDNADLEEPNNARRSDEANECAVEV